MSFGSSRRDLSESTLLLRKRAAHMAQASIVVLSLADVFLLMRPSNLGFESRTRKTPVSVVSQWIACKSAVVMRLEDIAARDGVDKSVTHGTGPLQGARPSLQQTSSIHLAACPLLSQKRAADPRPSPLWSSPSSQALSSLSSPPSELSSATPTQPLSVVGWPVVQEFGRGCMSGVALSLFDTLLSRQHSVARETHDGQGVTSAQPRLLFLCFCTAPGGSTHGTAHRVAHCFCIDRGRKVYHPMQSMPLSKTHTYKATLYNVHTKHIHVHHT